MTRFVLVRLALSIAVAWGPPSDSAGETAGRNGSIGSEHELPSRGVPLRVSAIGRADAPVELSVSSPAGAGPEVRTTLAAGIVEWWRSLSSGLEHGITLAERPAGEGPLRIEVATSAELSPRVRSDGSIEARTASGQVALTYAHLVVVDSAGARIPSRMSVENGRVVLTIEEATARYPIVVDPLVTVVEEAVLLASDGAMSDRLGWSVALSADGTRAVVGAASDDTAAGVDTGSARVFRWNGASWVEEWTLVASGAASTDAFGHSVALSADGSRALVGAYSDDTTSGPDTGSARVFTRTGTTWSEEATLLASGGATLDYFGLSVALSADGTRALVGADSDDTAGGTDAGSVRVFARSGTSWAEEAVVVAAAAAASDNFGASVALSADGSRALVGAPYDDTAGGTDAGSVRAFARTGTLWAEEATLLASGSAPGDGFGQCVALSADASRAIVGASLDDTTGGLDAGTVRSFARTGTSWAEDAILVGTGGAANDLFGSAVALSTDGTRALVGAYWDNTAAGTDAGSAYLFIRSAGWAEQARLGPSGGAAGDWFGWSVALSSDGSRALVSAPFDDTARGTDAGSVHVFGFVPAAADGTPCSSGAECLSGFCTDGVCCAERCGDGDPSDCEACNAASTGAPSGACAPLTAVVASTVTCRPAASLCDLAEVCDAASRACPVDRHAPSTVVCRPAVMPCDAAETCTGAGPVCPRDDPAPASTVCRAPVGACDAEERCDGMSPACPGDARIPAGVACGGTGTGSCSSPGLCDGTSANCPGATPRPAGTVCLERNPASPCDVDDVCDGTTDVCRAAFVAAGTECAPSSGQPCDAPDHCTGASGECLPEFLAGIACRPSAGTCDAPEICVGDSPNCPGDEVLAAGVPCRASTDLSCDAEEVCDGTAMSCPADVTTCRDADPGRDSGLPADVGPATDAGSLPSAAAGCGCRTAGARTVPSGAIVLALFAALWRRRATARAAT